MQSSSLLLFSKTVDCNEAKTRLRGELGEERTRTIHTKMVFTVAELCEAWALKAAVHCFWYPEVTPSEPTVVPAATHESQRGESFGMRLANAINDTMTISNGGIIVIGSDCPSLTLSDLEEADSRIQEGRAAIGPSVDGGVYLIGLPAQFSLAGFANCFEGPAVCEALLAYFKPARPAILRALSDVDTPADAREFYGEIS